MNKTKKIIALLLCVVMVCASSVFATVAYLTSRDAMLNTFTVGNVAIDLEETKVTPDGKPVDPAEKTQTGNEYHLIPGNTYVKDPTITIKAESEEAYVRMVVTMSNYAGLKAVFGDDFLPQNFVQGWDAAEWPCVAIVDNGNDTVTYEFRYKEAVEGNAADYALPALFTSFELPGEVTGEELALLDGFKILVEGNAIQTSTFADADAAWAAFDAQVGA